MTNKATKYGLMTIAAVLLVALAFAGAASADYTLQGAGTEADPYQISTALDLYNITQNTTYYQTTDKTLYFKLMNDIQISDIKSIVIDTGAKTVTVKNESMDSMEYNWDTDDFTPAAWTPKYDSNVTTIAPSLSSWPTIGNSTSAVTGNIKFDGDNKKICGIFINSTDANQSLFGNILSSAVVNITNLTLKNAFIYSTKDNVGGFVGLVGWTGTATVTFENCQLDESFISGNGCVGGLAGATYNTKSLECTATDCYVEHSTIVSRGFDTGGMFGYTRNPIIRDCSIEGCNISSNTKWVGGLIAYVGNSATVTGCTVTNCTVNASGQCTGILVGYSKNIYLSECAIVNSNVSSNDIDVGGIVGYAESATITACTAAECNVFSSMNSVGGLVGDFKNSATVTNCSAINCSATSSADGVGGLIGNIEYGPVTINNSYFIGRITGTSSVGGLVGKLPANSEISNCVALNEKISAASNSGRIVGDNLGTISDCYSWDGMTINGNLVSGGVGSNKDGADLSSGILWSNQSFFEKTLGWNFTTAWKMNSGNDKYNLPVLYWQNSPVSGDAAYLIPITVTFDTQGGSAVAAQNISKGLNATRPAENPTKAGYIFENWYNESICIGVFDFSAKLTADTTAYANWTVAPAKEFVKSGDEITLDPGYTVSKINVSGTGINNISFAYNQSVAAPTRSGYHDQKAFGDAFNITVTNGSINGGKAKIFFNISKADLGGLDTENIVLAHVTNGIWEYLPTEKVSEGSEYVQFSAETTSFSPFYPMYMTANTYTVHFDANGGQGSMADMTFTFGEGQNLTANAFQRYNSNFLYWTYNGTKYYNNAFVQNLTNVSGGSVTMTAQWETYSTGGSSSGSTYMGSNSASYTPTQQPTVKPTVKPTVAPTAAPTEKPATPTVIATEKPTTQATQQSPAPFVGLLAGLGAAAIVLGRLRK